MLDAENFDSGFQKGRSCRRNNRVGRGCGAAGKKDGHSLDVGVLFDNGLFER